MNELQRPSRIFLDTNVFIVGTALEDSPEARILDWVGYGASRAVDVEVVVSEELFEQILRVGQRVRNKDWGGEIVSRIWNDLNLAFTMISEPEAHELEKNGIIPREDVRIYLSARGGQAQCFVSANHGLIKALSDKTGEFESLTPDAFVSKYIDEG